VNGIEALLWVGPISILLALPFMCAWDLMERRVPLYFFGAILSINLIPTCLIYGLGGLSMWHLVVALVLCVLAFGAWRIGLFGGADRNLLCVIALFYMWNPFSPRMDVLYLNHIAGWCLSFFMVYFIVAIIVTPMCIFAFNIGMGNHRNYAREYRDRGEILIPQTPYTIREMFLKVGGGIPFVIPIAAAFVLSLVMGV
jgi:hypothetical protein